MSATKQRLSASVDADLIAAAEAAAKRGDVANVSAWVNEAMRMKLEHERGLAALADFITEYEAEFGTITEQDMASAEREARLRGREDALIALEELGREPAAAIYARAHAGPRPDEGDALFRTVLVGLLLSTAEKPPL